MQSIGLSATTAGQQKAVRMSTRLLAAALSSDMPATPRLQTARVPGAER